MVTRRNKAWAAVLALAAGLLLATAPAAHAATPEAEQAFEEARQAAKSGPQDIPLASQAVLKLPKGTSFIPQPQATRLLNAMGNPGQDSRLQGLVFPEGENGWFVTIRYEASGYIKDDDAKDWNADDLLKSYREGTEAANEERLKMGSPALLIMGWAEKPAYDAATHRLAWAMISRQKDAPLSAAKGVNYNTYALGREGYFSLNLVTGLDELPKYKAEAHVLLGALNFNDGKRYADFNAKTDHVAEYGLAALVVGVAAKKLGLLAVGLAFFAKFAKLGLLLLAGGGAAIMKFFRRAKPNDPA